MQDADGYQAKHKSSRTGGSRTAERRPFDRRQKGCKKRPTSVVQREINGYGS
jgi:hypothetical protein